PSTLGHDSARARYLLSFPTRRSSDLLQGEIRTGADGVARFSSGIANYPPIGASACPVRATDLAAIYCDFGGARHIRVGHLSQDRSEEHTSELQSRENLVCRLLLETKN